MKYSIAFIVVISLAIACGQLSDKDGSSVNKQLLVPTGKLIPINFNDTNYVGIELYARDTITKSGWKIKYFVKDDSTKYSDLYIQWSNGKKTGLYYGSHVLLMRRYFIPCLVGENETHIFLHHGCATRCIALLTLSKDSTPRAIDYPYVLKYDLSAGQLVYIPERSYTLDTLEVSVVDLKKQKEKSAIFRNSCVFSDEQDCIDSIYFDKNRIIISATLIDKSDKNRARTINEKHEITFDR